MQSIPLTYLMFAVTLLLAPMTAWEAFIGHYRSGFPLKAQYAPLGTAAILAIAAATGFFSHSRSAAALQIAGWIGIASGLIGAAYHHYYGIADKPGGYRWLLHQVMLHAPPLAPLSQAALGALLIAAGRMVNGEASALGLPMRSWVLGICAVTILGAAMQSAILHYRGAFNNALMYLPVTIPLIAALALTWQGIAPSPLGAWISISALWLTFLTGFIGVGMHIRGVDRQMGGLYVARANLLQGPPLTAPLVFSGFAATALAALRLG